MCHLEENNVVIKVRLDFKGQHLSTFLKRDCIADCISHPETFPEMNPLKK